MSDGPEENLAWEQLVTDGHVRAARVRRIQPLLIVVAIGLMLLGWFFIGLIRPSKAENDRATVLESQVERQQWRAVDAFAGMPPPRVGRSKIASLPAASGIADIQARILAELNQSNGVPEDLNLRAVEPPAFWRTAWEPGRFMTTSSGSVRVVGAVVNAGSAEMAGQVYRWLGVFRKQDGTWSGASVEAPGFIAIEGSPSVSIATIPVTLGPILETKE